MKRLVSSSNVPVKRHQTGKHTLKNQGAGRRAVFGVNAVGDFEEDAVAGHGVGGACAAEDGGVHRAEGADDHGDGNPRGGDGAGDVLDDIGSDVRRGGDGGERQNFQAGGAEEKID